jgi:ribosomal protein S27E
MPRRKTTLPFTVRWSYAIQDDENPILTWRALVAAQALLRYADPTTGHNCFPGAKACAANMRVSEDTIHRGWKELVEAGWLEIRPLPQGRRRVQGALKVLRWPSPERETADAPPRPIKAPKEDPRLLAFAQAQGMQTVADYRAAYGRDPVEPKLCPVHTDQDMRVHGDGGDWGVKVIDGERWLCPICEAEELGAWREGRRVEQQRRNEAEERKAHFLKVTPCPECGAQGHLIHVQGDVACTACGAGGFQPSDFPQ